MVLGTRVRPYPGVKQEGRQAGCTEWGKVGKARRLPQKARWVKGRAGNQDTEELQPVQKLGNKSSSKQVWLVRGSPLRRESLQVPVGTDDSGPARRPTRERKANQNGQTTGKTGRCGTNKDF